MDLVVQLTLKCLLMAQYALYCLLSGAVVTENMKSEYQSWLDIILQPDLWSMTQYMSTQIMRLIEAALCVSESLAVWNHETFDKLSHCLLVPECRAVCKPLPRLLASLIYSGRWPRCSSYTSFVTQHACVITSMIMSRLTPLERNPENMVQRAILRASYLIGLVSYIYLASM